MARAIITFKIMPKAPDVNLAPIIEEAKKLAKQGGAMGEMQVQEEPIAFGLKAILLMAMYDVEGGDFEAIATKMSRIKKVQSAQVTKMDLALG